MRILTLENQCFSLNNLPEQIEDDVRFAVLDNSDSKNPDFFFMPLIFLESFSAPAMVLEIKGSGRPAAGTTAGYIQLVVGMIDWKASLTIKDRNLSASSC